MHLSDNSRSVIYVLKWQDPYTISGNFAEISGLTYWMRLACRALWLHGLRRSGG